VLLGLPDAGQLDDRRRELFLGDAGTLRGVAKALATVLDAEVVAV
jgi:hypothetical protein